MNTLYLEVDTISEALQELLEAGTPEENIKVLEKYPELLTEETDLQLSELIDQVKGLVAEDIINALVARQTWLQELREAIVTPKLSASLQEDLSTAQTKYTRYLKTRRKETLEEAIVAWERVLKHPSLADIEEELQLAIFNNVAGIYVRRYWEKHTLEDLDQALFYWEKLTIKLTKDSPYLPIVLNNLGVAWSDRYQNTKNVEEVNRAIEYLKQAVLVMPTTSPDLPGALTHLGTALRNRYLQLGKPQDLQETIDRFQQALRLIPADSPQLPNLFSLLGKGLYERYRCHREIEDLQEAIEFHQHAVTRTSTDSPDLLNRLYKLQELQRFMDVFVKTGRHLPQESKA
jgi:tetratricopeptide (TPR) repeat protein